ncbi:hypothetical protein TrST_g5129 [Triparma strigata]|uniref:Uncharacterized protein n=1 Tax=Triparma strigata TaxID=1606541 RepID=A0A9W7EJH4_9STRA|nr:hypothetical protein TrST_g5129 [Triparma strigata]
MSVDMKAKAEAAKAEGNTHFTSKNYDDAIECYSSAIEFDNSNHLYFSNRAACYAAKGDWDASKSDATECVKLSPSFVKGYYRLTQANLELSLFDEATNVAKSGLQLDPDNSELQKQMQKQMRHIKAKKAAKASADGKQSLGRSSPPHLSSNHMAEPYTHYIGDNAITTRDDVLPFLQNMYEIGKPGPFLSGNMKCMVCKPEPARIDLNATQDVTSIARNSKISGPHVNPADRMWPAPYEWKSRVNLCIECAGSWMSCFSFYGAKGS